MTDQRDPVGVRTKKARPVVPDPGVSIVNIRQKILQPGLGREAVINGYDYKTVFQVPILLLVAQHFSRAKN